MPESIDFLITRASQLTVPNKDWTHYRSGLKLRCSYNSSGVTLVIVSQGKPIDTSHITETNVKFLTKEPIVGLKISDGDTLKKRVQITFDSAGHFNLFASKIKLWLGLSVVVSQSLEDQLSMSQEVFGSQSQRRNDAPKVENGEPAVAVQSQRILSQAPPNSKDLHVSGSQTVQASQPFQASQAQASQAQASQQVASQQAASETVPDGSIRTSPSFSQNANQTDTFAAPGWQVNSPHHNPNCSLPSNNFTQLINHLMTAAQCLQAESTGVIPQANTTSQASDPTWNGPYKMPYDGTQYPHVFDHDRTYYSPRNTSFSNVLSQSSMARPDDTCLSQSTQRFDNSCFSIDRSKDKGTSPDTTFHGAEKPSITEHDLRNALQDIPFEVPADGPARKTRSGSKMDGLLKKALEEVMKNDDDIEELDDMSLRLKIAQRLKSRSFRAFVKRVDKLVGDKLHQ